ncbi:AP-3 complex subunit delta-1 [Pteropus vampyrus]|uniref:AP-3 complex subunit delta-1 n=1 Tax=Pteropus vampyrus TaxID=132908 RepID=A0A6P6D2A6_PTEVA|nr:AP-3 complex subunit delta-1 [Pteropus vampyrus]
MPHDLLFCVWLLSEIIVLNCIRHSEFLNFFSFQAKYISQCIDEIKQELKQDNIAVKANAVCKLTYLQMLGYDISWAAFNIIEVMSASKFTFKRIGYLAASQCFHEGTDVIMLTTNQIRKDLSSPSQYDTGVALTGLSCFVTPDLARDLANDIMTLVSYLLRNILINGDPSYFTGVQSAAVNVICELARRNPKNYLSLAPLFFKLMTSSTNNWVLIKIIKLFGALTPLEPRLGKKLIEPLTNLIHSTSAMSLLYECVNTVIAVTGPLSSGVRLLSPCLQLCVQKLRILIEDSDQNLKYLGLLAMSKILRTHPKSVQAHKDLVLQCLDDKDESIRLRALDLLYGMVSKKSLMEIVKKLMSHVDKAEGTAYRDELLTKIVDICSQANYQHITNFEWYISILAELTRLEGTRHGHLIASQMLDVAIRVKAIRKFAVSQMSVLLDSAHLLASSTQRNGICEVLYAAAWICGEFSEHLQEPHQTLEAMLRPKVTTLPGHIQAVYVQNVVKLYASILQQKERDADAEAAQELTRLMVERLPQFVQSADLEVQERASCILHLVKHIQKLQAKDVPVAEEVSALFAGELNPVAPKAQKKVPVPEGLDLDAWINEPPSDSESEDETPKAIFHDEEQRPVKQRPPEADEEELARRREARKQEQANNPFYIKSSPSPQKVRPAWNVLQRHPPSHSRACTRPLSRYSQGQDFEGFLDRNALPSDEDDKDPNDPYRALDIDLDKPLADSEKLPIQKHRNAETSKSPENEDVPVVGKKSKKPKKKEKKHREKERERKKEKEQKSEDLDFWLSTTPPPAAAPALSTWPFPFLTYQTFPATQAPGVGGLGPAPVPSVSPRQRLSVWPSRQSRGAAVSSHDTEVGGPGRSGRSALLATCTSCLLTQHVACRRRPGACQRVSRHKGRLGHTGGGHPDPDPGSHHKPPPLGFLQEEPGANATVTAAEEEHEEPQQGDEGEEERDREKKPSKHKKKKHKKDKEERSKDKKKSKKKPPAGDGAAEPVENGTLEEEPLPPMSSYCLLAENAYVKMTYDIQGSLQKDSQVTVSIVLENQSNSFLKSMELNVLDSLNTKLARPEGSSVHDGVAVPFQLPPGISNEAQFVFTIQSIVMAQKLKGTLSFIAKNDEGSTHEKLDFKLHFSCTSYLITTPCYSDAFAKLLESGDLSMSSVRVDGISMSFQNLLAKICFHHHFSVVERVDSCASLYSRSIQGHHVCLLVKKGEKSVSVDGKCSDSALLSGLLEEVRATLAKC